MKLLAIVKFNQEFAFVFDEIPPIKHSKIRSNLMYGTDESRTFYKCYKYGKERGAQAFAGIKFRLEMVDGSFTDCNGDWWDAGHGAIQEHLRVKFKHVACGTMDNLKKCYVFTSYEMDSVKYQQFLENHSWAIPYRDYEKTIKYDDLWKKYLDKTRKLEAAKKNLISECKRLKKLSEQKPEPGTAEDLLIGYVAGGKWEDVAKLDFTAAEVLELMQKASGEEIKLNFPKKWQEV